ncbi:MAG: hypothetical protein PW789_19290 [Edaphobacter sp.]|uniref:hypothetical protein n=1 Tax=Edaphobacter sp. TaxID=1934404 RepID=UPI00239374BF|nr:hypothetical protein [Edaphobacter sp.]MDE1178725.1 hypothetical protein [Edaphobacter sp.]
MSHVRRSLLCLLAIVTLACTTAARADVAFLMEDPYGGFGNVNPTGHGALYFNHICAASPTELRPCRPDELGVVISRYHKVGGYDWLAIPVVPYLYAVDNIEDAPLLADAGMRDRMRDAYRREHLREIVPDAVDADGNEVRPRGDWYQLVGSSYDRRIYGFQIETSFKEDERFIAHYNDRKNISHFNLFFHNCADFSRVVLNSYFPHAVHRNYVADFGLTTPKQVARSLQGYAKKHPERAFTVFSIPQVQGTIPRSHPIHGVAESLVKSKKYIVPLAFLFPHTTAAIGVTYLAEGRFSPPKDAEHIRLPGEDARTIVARREELKEAGAVASATNDEPALTAPHGVHGTE